MIVFKISMIHVKSGDDGTNMEQTRDNIHGYLYSKDSEHAVDENSRK